MFETVFNSFVHNIAPTIIIFPNIPIIVEKQAKNVYGKYSLKFRKKNLIGSTSNVSFEFELIL